MSEDRDRQARLTLKRESVKTKTLNLTFGANTLRACAEQLARCADEVEQGEFLHPIVLLAGVEEYVGYTREVLHATLYEGYEGPNADSTDKHEPDIDAVKFMKSFGRNLTPKGALLGEALLRAPVSAGVLAGVTGFGSGAVDMYLDELANQGLLLFDDDGTVRRAHEDLSGTWPATLKQLNHLESLAGDVAGGIAAVERKVGKPISEFTRDEAARWINDLKGGRA